MSVAARSRNWFALACLGLAPFAAGQKVELPGGSSLELSPIAIARVTPLKLEAWTPEGHFDPSLTKQLSADIHSKQVPFCMGLTTYVVVYRVFNQTSSFLQLDVASPAGFPPSTSTYLSSNQERTIYHFFFALPTEKAVTPNLLTQAYSNSKTNTQLDQATVVVGGATLKLKVIPNSTFKKDGIKHCKVQIAYEQSFPSSGLTISEIQVQKQAKWSGAQTQLQGRTGTLVVELKEDAVKHSPWQFSLSNQVGYPLTPLILEVKH